MTNKTDVRPDDVGTDDAEQMWADLDQAEGLSSSGGDLTETDKGDDLDADQSTTVIDIERKSENETSPVTTVIGGSDDDTARADKPSAQADIWSEAPKDLRTAHEALVQQLEGATERERRMAANVPAQTRKINELIAENNQLKDTQSKGEASKSPSIDDDVLPDDIINDPEFQQASSEYPELFGPIEKALRRVNEGAKKIEDQVNSLNSAEKERYLDSQVSILSQAHPDFEKVTALPEFAAFVATLPPYAREAFDRNAEQVTNGHEAADIIARFKTDMAFKSNSPAPAPEPVTEPKNSPPLSQKRQQQLEASASPKPRGPAKVTTGVPDDPSEAWAYYEQLDRQKG